MSACRAHTGVFQPLRRGTLATSYVHPPPPQPPSWPTMTISIGYKNPNTGTTGLTICIINTIPPMGDQSKVALTIAPKMATGEADAVPRVGSKWGGCWAGCGKITAVGVSHRSGRIFCRSVDNLALHLSSYRELSLAPLPARSIVLPYAAPFSGISIKLRRSQRSAPTLT